MAAFEAARFNHSRTSPRRVERGLDYFNSCISLPGITNERLALNSTHRKSSYKTIKEKIVQKRNWQAGDEAGRH